MKITKNGKILTSGVGVNHYQAKKSRSSQLKKKRWGTISEFQAEAVRAYLKH